MSFPPTTSGTHCTRSWWNAGRKSRIGCPATKPATWSSADTSGEDNVTLAYLQGAAEAGLHTVGLAIEQPGWDRDLQRFVDLEDAPISTLFKPVSVGMGARRRVGRFAANPAETMWIEPLWKSLLSNKAILAVLWEMYPGHPSLLPAYIDDPHELINEVASPSSAARGERHDRRRGLRDPRPAACTAEEGYMYQLLDPLPQFDDMRPALGAWIVGDESAGLDHSRDLGSGHRQRRSLCAPPHPAVTGRKRTS